MARQPRDSGTPWGLGFPFLRGVVDYPELGCLYQQSQILSWFSRSLLIGFCHLSPVCFHQGSFLSRRPPSPGQAWVADRVPFNSPIFSRWLLTDITSSLHHIKSNSFRFILLYVFEWFAFKCLPDAHRSQKGLHIPTETLLIVARYHGYYENGNQIL